MESDVNSVLEYLLSKGQIPSFSFPLDSTMFAAEMIGSKKDKSVKHMARYTRDTKLAISELAPGQQRTVNGQKLEIGGLYFEFTKDRIDRARPFFEEFDKLTSNRVSLCLNPQCGWVSEDKTTDLTGEPCPICITSKDPKVNKTNVKTYLILKPEGLSPICVPHDNNVPQKHVPIDHETGQVHPIIHKEVSKKTARFSGRVQLPAPATEDISNGEPFWQGSSDWNLCQLFIAEESSEENLGTEFVIINPGPDEEGFQFCGKCGASLHKEHIVHHHSKSFPNRHYRPYIISQRELSLLDADVKKKIQHGCDGLPHETVNDLPIAMGLRFMTDLILFRFDITPDNQSFNFDWTMPSFHGAIMGLRDSLQIKLVEELKLMHREINAGYRLVSKGRKKYVDIFLYDSVSGGAGLVSQVKKMKNKLSEYLDSAITHLNGSSCLEKKACSRACVGCLLDFKNRRDHDTINRPLAWSIAQFFKSNRKPSPNDFGLDSEGNELDRLDGALSAYANFIGDNGDGIKRIGDAKIKLPSGREWEIVSPFFEDDYVESQIRIDTLEVFDKAITKEFNNRSEDKDPFSF